MEKSETTTSSPATQNPTPSVSQEEKEKQAELEMKKLFEELKSEKVMSSSYQLKRLMNSNFLNPFEVLMIAPESSDDEIKKQYRQLSVLIHPDKCQDPQAAEAFHIVESAYKTLLDQEKKKYYQRILREAKERVEYDREKENKSRTKKGLPPLPSDTIDSEIRATMKKIIDEIEEKKKYTDDVKFSYKKRERDEEENKKTQEEAEKQLKKEWESYRDKRVKNWNKFKGKITNGKKRAKYETKPPKYKVEERIDEQHVDLFRPNSII